METNWLKLEDAPLPSRFRFRMEQAVQRGSSELHVLQMNQSKDDSEWPAQSDNPEQEAEMLRAVAQYLVDSADSAPVSMIAEQAISAKGKISLQETDTGDTFIRVGLSFPRAWASLARALETSTFEITDRDRSTGVYYVNFIGADGEEEDGWFDWLFEEEDHPLAGRDFLVKMTSENDASVAITLSQPEGSEPVETRQKQALLAMIKGNIN